MFLRVSASALLLAGLIGCTTGRTSSAPAGASPAQAPLTIATIAGQYALLSVDGQALPYAPVGRGGKVEPSARPVASGSFALKADGTFRLETIYNPPGQPASTGSGACYPEGDQLKMAWDGGGLTNMTVRGDTVLLNREGVLYAYLRKP
jgi:hypothetical protein